MSENYTIISKVHLTLNLSLGVGSWSKLVESDPFDSFFFLPSLSRDTDRPRSPKLSHVTAVPQGSSAEFWSCLLFLGWLFNYSFDSTLYLGILFSESLLLSRESWNCYLLHENKNIATDGSTLCLNFRLSKIEPLIRNINVLLFKLCWHLKKSKSLFLFDLALIMSYRQVDVIPLSPLRSVNSRIYYQRRVLPRRLSLQVSQGSPALLCFPKNTRNSASVLNHFVIF